MQLGKCRQQKKNGAYIIYLVEVIVGEINKDNFSVNNVAIGGKSLHMPWNLWPLNVWRKEAD